MLGFIFFEVESFTPAGRLSHSSVLVGNKIYFFGGALDYIRNSDEVFYLDVSKSFDIANPPWVDLTSIPFASEWATVALDDLKNDTNIYLF